MKRLIAFLVFILPLVFLYQFVFGGTYLLDDLDKMKDGDSITYDNKVKWTEPNTATISIAGVDTVIDKNPPIKATIHHHNLGNGQWKTTMDIDGERSEGTSTQSGDTFTTKLDKVKKPKALIDAINAAKVK